MGTTRVGGVILRGDRACRGSGRARAPARQQVRQAARSHAARDKTKPSESNDLKCRRTQSGREDSNLRPLDPQSSALTRLRYAPSLPRAPWRDGSGRG